MKTLQELGFVDVLAEHDKEQADAVLEAHKQQAQMMTWIEAHPECGLTVVWQEGQA